MRLRSAIKSSQEAEARHLSYHGDYFHYLGLRPSNLNDSSHSTTSEAASSLQSEYREDQIVQANTEHQNGTLQQTKRPKRSKRSPGVHVDPFQSNIPTMPLSSEHCHDSEKGPNDEVDPNDLFESASAELVDQPINDTVQQSIEPGSVDIESDTDNIDFDSSDEDILVEVFKIKHEKPSINYGNVSLEQDKLEDSYSNSSSDGDDEPDLQLEGEEYIAMDYKSESTLCSDSQKESDDEMNSDTEKDDYNNNQCYTASDNEKDEVDSKSIKSQACDEPSAVYDTEIITNNNSTDDERMEVCEEYQGGKISSNGRDGGDDLSNQSQNSEQAPENDVNAMETDVSPPISGKTYNLRSNHDNSMEKKFLNNLSCQNSTERKSEGIIEIVLDGSSEDEDLEETNDKQLEERLAVTATNYDISPRTKKCYRVENKFDDSLSCDDNCTDPQNNKTNVEFTECKSEASATSSRYSNNMVIDDSKIVVNGKWTVGDVKILLDKIGQHFARPPMESFLTTLKKVDWNAVKFGTYSADDCEDIAKRLIMNARRYRLLNEVTQDLKRYIGMTGHLNMTSRRALNCSNDKKCSSVQNTRQQKKPISATLRYIEHKISNKQFTNKDDLKEARSKYRQRFKTLPMHRKRKYINQYEEEIKIYRKQCIDCTENVIPDDNQPKQIRSEAASDVPLLPRNPRDIYVARKMKKMGTEDRSTRKFFKKEYPTLSDEKKFRWIRKAKEDQERYEKEILEYKEAHPEFEVTQLIPKSLTVEEHSIFEKFSTR